MNKHLNYNSVMGVEPDSEEKRKKAEIAWYDEVKSFISEHAMTYRRTGAEMLMNQKNAGLNAIVSIIREVMKEEDAE